MDSVEDLKEAFRIFDKDASGFISLAELRFVMLSNNNGYPVTEADVDEMLR